MNTLEIHIPGHVHHRFEPNGGVVMIDSAAGTWFALNSTAGELWRHWAADGDFERAAASVAARHGEVPSETIRHDAECLLAELLDEGLISMRARNPAGMAMVASRPSAASTPRGWPTRLALFLSAHLCVFLAVVLTRVSFRWACALVRCTRRSWCNREPGSVRAAQFVDAVSRAADHYPGRAACLERSLASVLLAALVRSRLDWCLGSIPDPYRFHAWVESNGRAVDDPRQAQAAESFSRVLAL